LAVADLLFGLKLADSVFVVSDKGFDEAGEGFEV
jgi:hypothetical protein